MASNAELFQCTSCEAHDGARGPVWHTAVVMCGHTLPSVRRYGGSRCTRRAECERSTDRFQTTVRTAQGWGWAPPTVTRTSTAKSSSTRHLPNDQREAPNRQSRLITPAAGQPDPAGARGPRRPLRPPLRTGACGARAVALPPLNKLNILHARSNPGTATRREGWRRQTPAGDAARARQRKRPRTRAARACSCPGRAHCAGAQRPAHVCSARAYSARARWAGGGALAATTPPTQDS